MAKRKPSIVIEEVLPDDDRLGERGKLWKCLMETIRVGSAVIEQQLRLWYLVIVHGMQAFRRWLVLRGRKRKLDPPPLIVDAPDELATGEPPPKYAKTKDRNEMELENVCNMLDYEVSDKSDASDVETDALCEEEDFPLENREELDKQLEQVVAVRKRNWAQNGLLKLMESIEAPDHNMLSHEKVEKWLFGQRGPLNMTQANETVMTERNADGDRMKYHRKQQVTVSRSIDDADSLYSVDTAKYILQNKRDRNTTSKIKVTTMIKQYTISTNSSNALAIRPNLHSISNFPIINEEPSTSLLHKTSKSDSAFETGEDQTQNRSNERSTVSQPSKSTKPPVVEKTEKGKRKKVFKKTVKKSATKSPSSKGSAVTSQKYEEALKSCVNVKKVPNPKSRRIHWQETSHILDSSSDESDGVFTRNTRSKTKPSSKRDLRSSTKSSSRSSVTPEQSPRKKATSPRKRVNSPRKNVDRDLLLPFEAICLSPSKRNAKPQPQVTTQQMNKTVDQTTNLTALFSGANEKITNSTEINNTTAFSNRSVKSNSSWNRNATDYPDEARSIVVYEPKTIQPNLGPKDVVRINYADLKLEQVTKPRHLDKFKTFTCLIHPNSTVRFFPSDSEEDLPAPAKANTLPLDDDDDDESYDEDDPILTFNLRDSGRLKVLEYPYNTQNRSNERSTVSQPSKSTKPPVVEKTEKGKRKKVFKKTVKKSATKSPSSKGSAVTSQKYEEALKSCVNVKKVPNPKSRRIHWQETSHILDSSSDESDGVFTRNTRSKTKPSSKRDLRSSTKSSSRSSVTPEQSPRKKATSPRKRVNSPRKNVDRDLLLPFEAICLSPSKRNAKPQPQVTTQQMNKTVDQTTNLTALFSGANEKITNSTEINNTTAFSNRSVKSNSSWNRNATDYPDEARSIVVYEPKTIQPNLGPKDVVRINYADLKLEQVTKPRHLDKFKTFTCLIHPNSTVRFFPSDSEEDLPAPAKANTLPLDDDDDDESYDEDDPILTFNLRDSGRLKVLEYPYNVTHF